MGNWEAKIYINGELKTSLIVKNSTSLIEIRNLLDDSGINIPPFSYFISRNNSIIRNENNFTAKHVWNDDEEGGYKIDLMSPDYFENNNNQLVNLYFNMYRHSSIRYCKEMSLERIKGSSYDLNKDNIYFLNKNNIIIRNTEGLSAKNIVKFENNGKRINLVDLEYYKRYQIIEHLNELEKKANIDWLEETEFFKKLKNLTGNEVVQGIEDELFRERQNGVKGSKAYIKRFLQLLIADNNNQSISTSIHDDIGF
jgi:hypothetical protein